MHVCYLLNSACVSTRETGFADGDARERPVFRPGQPACRRQSWALATVCAGGAAGPVAALARAPGRRAAWPHVPGGQGTSRWLLSGGQRGLSAAALARVRGGRIKVIVAWWRARRPGRLCRRHQPPPGDAGQVPRCPGPGAVPHPPLVRAPCPG